jgi:hypothetical protein
MVVNGINKNVCGNDKCLSCSIYLPFLFVMC